MRLLTTIAALSLASLTAAGCQTIEPDAQKAWQDFKTRDQADTKKRLAEADALPKFGKCSTMPASEVDKTVTADLVRQLRACGWFFKTSRRVSASGEDVLISIPGTVFAWYFVNGTLKSYRT